MPETDIYPDEITSLFELVKRAKALFGDATYIIATEPGTRRHFIHDAAYVHPQF